jgi:hypothetical protein
MRHFEIHMSEKQFFIIETCFFYDPPKTAIFMYEFLHEVGQNN